MTVVIFIGQFQNVSKFKYINVKCFMFGFWGNTPVNLGIYYDMKNLKKQG